MPGQQGRNNKNPTSLAAQIDAKHNAIVAKMIKSRSLSPKEFSRPEDFTNLQLPPVLKKVPYGQASLVSARAVNPGIICGTGIDVKSEIKLPALKNEAARKQEGSEELEALLQMQDMDRKKNLDNLTLKQLERLKLIELSSK